MKGNEPHGASGITLFGRPDSINTSPLPGQNDSYQKLYVFSPNGYKLLSRDGGTIEVWKHKLICLPNYLDDPQNPLAYLCLSVTSITSKRIPTSMSPSDLGQHSIPKHGLNLMPSSTLR